MSKLIVERKSDEDIKMRDLFVTVDDTPERTLHFGQDGDWTLTPGEHTIKVTNRLFTKSETFQISEGETIRYEANNLWLKGIFAPLTVISGTGAYKVDLHRAKS